MAAVARGVHAMVIRMPQVHDQVRQGFASYLLDHARKTGLSAYVDEGLNRWPAVHRLDAGRLYRLVLEAGEAGRRYHAVAEEGVPMRRIADTIGKVLDLPVISLPAAASAQHFGWLDRVARMDAPACSALTRQTLGWRPLRPERLLDDLGALRPAERI